MSATGEFQCQKCFHVGTKADFVKRCPNPNCGSLREPLDLDMFQHPMRDPGEGKIIKKPKIAVAARGNLAHDNTHQ